MSFKSPRSLAIDSARATAAREAGHSALEKELKSEQAAALGRTGRAVEEALAALREAPDDLPQAARDELIDEAAHAVWIYFIQREACGLNHHQQAIDFYRIPGRVLGRVGATNANKR